jgi:hypothetical protein
VTPGLRRLYVPAPVAVQTGAESSPLAVAGVAVEAVRERWLIDERWWIPQRLRREYFELALADGRAIVVYRCEESGRWYRQRA